jgi:hypothetical protein
VQKILNLNETLNASIKAAMQKKAAKQRPCQFKKQIEAGGFATPAEEMHV